MLKNGIYAFLAGLILLSSGLAYAIRETKQVTLYLDKDPVHFVGLEVNFPPNFVEISDKYNPGISLFIPANENSKNWTQQIELQQFGNLDKTSGEYVHEMKNRMHKEFPSLKILDENNAAFPDYNASGFTASMVQDNKPMLVIVKFYKSIEGFAGYVYRKKISGEITNEVVNSGKQFVGEHMIILNKDNPRGYRGR